MIPVHTGVIDNPSTLGAPTPERILDELAYARDDRDNPQSSMSINDMYNRIFHTIYGHAPIAEAQRQGFGGEPQYLMEQGRRPYFDRCIRDLLTAGRIVTVGIDIIALPPDATYEPGHEPGSGMRQTRRMNLALEAGSLLKAGLDKLFPPMGKRMYDELVESMRTEGYDISKPIVRDRQTGLTLDGRARERAADEAGVVPAIIEVDCSDDLERLRYAIRGNLMRRYMPDDDTKQIRKRLGDLHLSTYEMKRLLGRLVEGEGQVQSALVEYTPEPLVEPTSVSDSLPRRQTDGSFKLFKDPQVGREAHRYAYEQYYWNNMPGGPSLEEIGRCILEMYHPQRAIMKTQSVYSMAARYSSKYGLPMPSGKRKGNSENGV